MTTPSRPAGFAIVGIGCRFPGGADTPAAFWDLLARGGDAVTEAPPGRLDLEALFDTDPARPGTLYTRCGGYLEGIELFDAGFFGMSPREARRVDPQHRLLLEVAWEALEDGGQRPDRLAGSNTGVFVGISGHDYGDLQSRPEHRTLIDAHVNAGNGASMVANRLSYVLDLRGPSLAVDTACSSALTALHLAVASLSSGECDLAVVGAVNALITPEPTIGFCRAGMLSRQGRCRPFDARADGYVRSEGAGAVVLKPLDRAVGDGDPIYAVVRATGVSQDGRTTGISVPNPAAQEALIREVLGRAGLRPDEVGYVEAHGTGTPVGDPREALAVGAVMAGRPADRPCLIGSAKGNVGHLEAAAGIVGLVKAALALAHREIPPSLNFERPNPEIPFDDLRLRVPTVLTPWPDRPAGRAVAAVNSFGFGGANAHAVLEEAPLRDPPPEPPDLRPQPLVLSARSPEALEALARSWVRRLGDGDASVPDLCRTAALRRAHHDHHLVVVGATAGELAAPLEAFAEGRAHKALAAGRRGRGEAPKVAFVCPGMGPQWAGMGRALAAAEPAFAAALEDCDRLLRPVAGWSLLDALASDEATSPVSGPEVAHAANLALQVALAALWRSWGVVADAVVGHSSGEMAAACVAGALDLPDALRLAFHRGRLLGRKVGTGGMLAVGLPADGVAEHLRAHQGRVSLAAVNGPASVTLSGDHEALAAIAAEVSEAGRFARPLPVTVPYHGPQMDELRGELLAALEDLDSKPPVVPLMSTVTGAWHDGGPLDASYWWRNVRQPVRFADAVGRLADEGCELFVELGPHPVLAPSILECLEERGRDGAVLASMRRGEDDRAAMLRALGALHARGRDVAWASVFGRGGRCVALPPYPWQRERHWVDLPPAEAAPAGVDTGHPLLGRRLRAARPTWEAALGDGRLSFLEGHRVHGSAAFPGAGYVEVALAAARELREDGPLVLEHVKFERLLTLGHRRQVTLQCAVGEDGAAVEVHSATTEEPDRWELRSSARLSRRRPAAPPPVDVEAATARWAPVDVEACYRSMEANHGLDYQGAFRSLTALWQGDGQALGRVERVGAAEAGPEGWSVHPALLDAGFQVLAVAVAVAGAAPAASGVLLPVSVRRVEWHAPPGDRFWSRAAVTARGGSTVEAVVELVDDDGRVTVRCEGLRLKLLPAGREESVESLVHEERWELLAPWGPAAGDIPPASALAPAVEAALDASADRHGLGDYYASVAPALDAMAVRSARDAIERLGGGPPWPDPSEAAAAAARLGVAPRHRRFLGRLLALARSAAGAAPPPDPAELASAFPAYRSAVELVAQSAARLEATLRGEQDARDWMVAGPWLATLTEFYAVNPGFRAYTEAVAEAAALVHAAHRPGALRVLEVGAGTGGATAPVLDRLPPDGVDYLFTDASAFFLRKARQRFGHLQGFRTAVVDIESPPDGLGPFDLVIAADVVHATADVRATLANLRALLAPGGALVLMEAIGRSPWLDLAFGQFDGWWCYADRDLRRSHPLLEADTWVRVLEDAGLAAAAVTDDRARRGSDPLQAVLVATASRPAPPVADPAPRPGRRWLVLTDQGGVGPEVAAGLRERGDSVTLVWPGPEYRRFGVDGIELPPARVADWSRLVADVGGADGLVHLWSLDPPQDPTAADLMGHQARSCGSLVALLSALDAAGVAVDRFWLVTAGAQPVEEGDARAQSGVGQAPLWGLGRVLRTERGTGRCRLVDLGPAPAPEEVEALLRELDTDLQAGHPEIALRGCRRYAPRLERAPLRTSGPASVTRSPGDASFRLAVRRPGVLESLALREVGHRDPGPGEVAVTVVAGALNFRDVLVALGMGFASAGEDPVDVPLGWECAGVVAACGPGVEGLRPGDEVVAMAAGTLGSRIVTRAAYVVPKPPGLGFEAAATLPVGFLTARFALERLARLAPGERVLVHSATGGVGLAAVQVARRAGAEVLATAGTSDKRAFLRSAGVDHVMDSRSTRFAGEVLEATGGEGVDVILNSLSGDAVARGLEVLRPHGRFVEIGKRDIHEDGRLDLAPFRNNLSYLALDLHPLYERRPALVSEMLREVVDDAGAGRIEPLPHHDFDLSRAEQAFRLMAQARHIGKVVLSVRQAAYDVVPLRPPGRFRPDGTYLLTGGLGGFGLAVATWMAREGAGRIVLMSRSGKARPEDAAALEALTASAPVVVARGDVARPADVAGVLDGIRSTMPPLRGVLHAAMVLDDALLGTLDYPRFESVVAPKLAGAWNLHRLTAGDDLDAFVLFSSISAVIGQPAQASYAAGNAFLATLAAHRRALGLPALTVDWGVVAGVGYVARHPDVERRLRRQGLRGMAPKLACAALGEVLDAGLGRVVITSGGWGVRAEGPGPAGEDDPGRPGPPGAAGATAGASPFRAGAGVPDRPDDVLRHLLEAAARVLGLEPRRVDADRPLFELGFDSLMAVELRTMVRSDFGVEVPIAEMLAGLDVRRLAAMVQRELGSAEGPRA